MPLIPQVSYAVGRVSAVVILCEKVIKPFWSILTPVISVDDAPVVKLVEAVLPAFGRKAVPASPLSVGSVVLIVSTAYIEV